jgi:PIN domain nuclease of toxin-antitoxin system
VDVGLVGRTAHVPEPAPEVILLDTNAVIWVDRHHQRVRPLLKHRGPFFISPATLLELTFLEEAGRVRLRAGINGIVADARWDVDEPPPLAWFTAAADQSWTRDPFDRLIAAHAIVRGWRLASSDGAILDHLRPSERLPL